MRFTIALLLMFITSGLVVAEDSTTTQPAEATTKPAADLESGIPLKDLGELDPTGLVVTADGNWAVVTQIKYFLDKRGRSFKPPKRTSWLCDLQTGKRHNLAKLIPKTRGGNKVIHRVLPSGSGRYLLITRASELDVMMQRGTLKIEKFLLDLEAKKGWQIFKGSMALQVGWLGDQLVTFVFSGVTGPGRLKIVDPRDTDKVTELPIKAVFVAGSPDGKRMAVLANPEGLDKGFLSLPAMKENGHLMVLDADGKIVRDVMGYEEIKSRPIFSPRGWALAFQVEPDGGRRGMDKREVKVVSVKQHNDYMLDQNVQPVGLLDDGTLLAIEEKPGKTGGKLFKFRAHSAGDVLAGDALSATAVDKTVYYIAAGKDKQPPKLKAIGLE